MQRIQKQKAIDLMNSGKLLELIVANNVVSISITQNEWDDYMHNCIVRCDGRKQQYFIPSIDHLKI